MIFPGRSESRLTALEDIGGCQIRLSSLFPFFPFSGPPGWFRNFFKESGEKEVGSHWPFFPSGAHISQFLGPPGGFITGFAGGKRYCAKKRGSALTRPPRFSHNGPQGLLEPFFVIKSTLGTQFWKQSRRQSFLNCRENSPVRIMASFGHIFFWRGAASSHPLSDVWLSNVRWENCQDKGAGPLSLKLGYLTLGNSLGLSGSQFLSVKWGRQEPPSGVSQG